MSTVDPYALEVAFDDILGGRSVGHSFVRAALGVLRFLPRHYPKLVRHRVDVLGYDYTPWTWNLATQTVLGGEVPSGIYPLYDSLRADFDARIPPPVAVRVDTADSYDAFRQAREKANLGDVAGRLAALEQAVAEHVADQHGGGRLQRLEEAFARHLSEGHSEKVPVLLPPAAASKVDARREGDEVVCTISLCAPDGQPRLVTTGGPIAPHVERVIGAAEDAGAEPEEAAVLAVTLAPAVAGTSMVGRMASAQRDLLSYISRYRRPRVGALRSEGDAPTAAAMMLLQRCQQGDQVACREVARMQTGSGGRFIMHSLKALLRAQKRKARRGGFRG